jgi:hypothetical protein
MVHKELCFCSKIEPQETDIKIRPHLIYGAISLPVDII